LLRRFTLLVLVLGTTFIAAAPTSAQTGPPYPRLANAFWLSSIDSTMIPALAKWDVLVLNPVWSNAQLAQIRALNPEIKIYFYVITYALEMPSSSITPWKLGNYQYAEAHDLWWRDKNGGIGSDWPNTRMANVTALGAAGPQGTWAQFFVTRVESLVVSHPDLDGVFLDNFWQQISWQQASRQLDSDCNPTHNPTGCNGVADSNAVLDGLWNAALRQVAADIRARFDVLQMGRSRPLAILTNNATDYFESLNGAMIEYFPSASSNVDYDSPYGYNWNEEMITCPGGYLSAPFNPNPVDIRILNADWSGTLYEPAAGQQFQRIKRFTLVSALLGDGYYSLDGAASNGHSNLWWEDEYDHAGRGKGWLGYPLGPMVRVLQPTGAERIANADFGAGLTAWDGYGFGATGSHANDLTVFHDAPPSLRVDVQSVVPGGTYKIWQTSLPLTHHAGYTLSFWARASVAQQLTVHLYADACPNSRCWKDRRFCLDTTWRFYQVSFHANATATAALNLFVETVGSVWLDDLSLRDGDTNVFRRDFEHGVVVLNYTNTSQNVNLGGTLWRPKFPNSFLWNGARVTSELIPFSDARIVLRDSVIDPPDSTSTDTAPLPVRPRAVLHQNDPNPFNPTTAIRFELEAADDVRLAIYDVAGRRVRLLLEAMMPAGRDHRVVWDGIDDHGRAVRSGVYIYRLKTTAGSHACRMVLLR